MNIYFISNKLNINKGGSNFSLDLIARTLTQRQHNVTLVTTNITSENELPNDLPYDIVEYSLSKTDLLKPDTFSKVFNQYEDEADLYHVFSPLLAPYSGYYRASGGTTPVMGRLNQYRSLCSNVSKMNGECQKECNIRKRFRHSDLSLPSRGARIPFYFLQSKKYTEWMNKVDVFYAVSPEVKRIFSDFGVNEDIITVIPNFYDPDFYRFDQSVEPSISNHPKLLFVGRLSREKGVDTLLHAVSRSQNHAKLKIVGDGPQREELRNLATKLEICNQVTFCGLVDHDELTEYYVNADVFVHPSRWPEPFSRTLLEALQTDCAVIGAKTGGTPWALGDAGLLFPRDDNKRLANIIDVCYNNTSLVREKIYKGRERLCHFRPEEVVNTLENEMISFSDKV